MDLQQTMAALEKLGNTQTKETWLALQEIESMGRVGKKRKTMMC